MTRETVTTGNRHHHHLPAHPAARGGPVRCLRCARL